MNIPFFFSLPRVKSMEACGIFVQELSRVMTSPVRFFSTAHGCVCTPLMDSQPRGCRIPPGQPWGGNSPRPPRFPLWMQILAIDCFPSMLLQRKKSLILTDLYLDSLSFFFIIYLRISVYLLGRTLSSPMEATTEPWKTTKNKVCTKKKSIVSVIPQLREHKYWSLKYPDNLNHQFWQQRRCHYQSWKKSWSFLSRAGNLSHPEKTKNSNYIKIFL